MSVKYQITKRQLIASMLFTAGLLAGCGILMETGSKASIPDTPTGNINTSTPATMLPANDTTFSAQDEPTCGLDCDAGER